MTYFTEQVVKVNGSGLIADRATLNFDSPIQQIPAIGFKGSNATSLFGPIRATAQLSYIVQTSHEPFYELIKDLKTRHSTDYQPINLQIGDVTGAFFVESINYTVAQNDLVRSDVSLVSFETTASASVDKTVGYAEGDLGHGLYSSAELLLGQSNRVFDFSYSFRADWQPVYKIGSKIPMQVQLLNAEEQITITQEDWTHQAYSGEAYNTVTSLDIRGTGLSVLTFPLQSGIVKNRTLSVQPDDVARIQTTVTRIF